MESMTAFPQQGNPKPDFFAELTPHRSLSRTGFFVLMGFISVTCFISGIMFLVMGAWPVFIFMGLDVFVVWLAFAVSYRSARARETVSVNRHELKVQKFDPAGRMAEFSFNPFWTKFEVERHEEIGITKMALRSREQTLTIGSFLNPLDRESFATAFGNALGNARR